MAEWKRTLRTSDKSRTGKWVRELSLVLLVLNTLTIGVPLAHAQTPGSDEIEFEEKRPLLREKEETIVCAPGFKEIDGECIRTVNRKKTSIDFADEAITGEIVRPQGIYNVSLSQKHEYKCDARKLNSDELYKCAMSAADEERKKMPVPPILPIPVEAQAIKIAEIARATLQCPEYKDVAALKSEIAKISGQLDPKKGPSMVDFIRDPSAPAVRSHDLDRTLPIACGYPELNTEARLSPFATNFYCSDERTCFLQDQKYVATAENPDQIRKSERTRKDCAEYARIPGQPWRWRMRGNSCTSDTSTNDGDYTLLPAAPGVFIVIFHDQERKHSGSIGLIMAQPQFESDTDVSTSAAPAQ